MEKPVLVLVYLKLKIMSSPKGAQPMLSFTPSPRRHLSVNRGGGTGLSPQEVYCRRSEKRRSTDITLNILPFFAKYPLHGSKLADYNDFCEVAKIIDTKAHLTKEGLDQISKIKPGMTHRGRILY